MKKIKRVIAFLGVLVLLGLYGMTILCAIFDKSDTMIYWKTSLVSTVLLPSLLWIYIFIYKLLKKEKEDG